MFLSIYFDTTDNSLARQAVRIIAHTIKYFVRVLNCLIVFPVPSGRAMGTRYAGYRLHFGRQTKMIQPPKAD